jgi:hypothetical protein
VLTPSPFSSPAFPRMNTDFISPCVLAAPALATRRQGCGPANPPRRTPVGEGCGTDHLPRLRILVSPDPRSRGFCPFGCEPTLWWKDAADGHDHSGPPIPRGEPPGSRPREDRPCTDSDAGQWRRPSLPAPEDPRRLRRGVARCCRRPGSWRLRTVAAYHLLPANSLRSGLRSSLHLRRIQIADAGRRACGRSRADLAGAVASRWRPGLAAGDRRAPARPLPA